LTRPLLDPIRRILPTISGIDLSPLVVILLLQALLIFL
jgi:YggT family protein